MVDAMFFIFIVGLMLKYGFTNARGYTAIGTAFVFSMVFPFILFLSLWIEQLFAEWRIVINPWVKDVVEMDFWFNPMFLAWLYSHDKKRFIKYTIAISLPIVFMIGTFIVWFLTFGWVTLEDFTIGFMIGAAFTILIGITYYQNYSK